MVGRWRAAALAALLVVACQGGGDEPLDPPTYYQNKTPYRPQQDPATYEAPPPGYSAVYTQLVARHGSRGLASMKSDLIVYNMWQRAAQEGALTDLGHGLGPDVLAIMRANFLLGYGVAGITHPGYGNESHVGIREHTELAQRLLARRNDVLASLATTPRKIVVVSSGVDRAVDSAGFFVASLLTARPALAPLVTYPPAPTGYPEGHPQHQPDGTNRFLLYFHKLVPATDLVTSPTDPFYRTYHDSQAYFGDPDLLAKENAIAADPAARVQGRALLERLFARPFVDRIDSGALTFASTGTMTFTSDDGKFTSTLTGDGKATLASLADAGSYLWDLYSVAPGLALDGAPDMRGYFAPEEAHYFAYVADAYEFYDKGPSIARRATSPGASRRSCWTTFSRRSTRSRAAT